MGAFRSGKGDDLKFSQIVTAFTDHVKDGPAVSDNNLVPSEYNLSDFYRGGRYILERKDTYTGFPDVPDSSKLKVVDADAGVSDTDATGYYLLVSTSSKPEPGDIVRHYDANGVEVADDRCLTVYQVFHHADIEDQAVSIGIQVPKFESMSIQEKGVFNTAYWVELSSINGRIEYDDAFLKLQPGDKTGVVTEWKDRFSRCKLEFYRGDKAFKENMNSGSSGVIVNPSNNIPVEIPNDDDGTEIKFSDFWGGVGSVTVSSRQTSFNTSWNTTKSQNVASSRNTQRSTKKQTQYHGFVATSKVHNWQQSFQQVYSQPYTYYSYQSSQVTKRDYYQKPGIQQPAQSGGPGFRSKPYQRSYQPTRVYQGQPYQVSTQKAKLESSERKAYRTAYRPASSTKSWAWKKTWYKSTTKNTNVQTAISIQKSGQYNTERQTSRSTKLTFWG